MNEIKISDAVLVSAAMSVRDVMLNSMPSPFECEHKFSEKFIENMKPLFAKEKRQRLTHKIMRNVAAVFLAAVIGLGAWMAVDTEARASFVSWVKEIYENSIVYKFFGTNEAASFPAYRVTCLPEGFEFVDGMDEGGFYSTFWLNADTGECFEFRYSYMFTGTNIQLIDAENSVHETCEVNGACAEFYYADENSNTNNLIWVNEEDNIIFMINSDLDKSVMLHIAGDITLENPTK